MLNILNDRHLSKLKYFWRQGYELKSLRIWYALTRSDNSFFDVGAHTGIFSIIEWECLISRQIILFHIEPFEFKL